MDTPQAPQSKSLIQARVPSELRFRLLLAVFNLKKRGDASATIGKVVTDALTEWLDRNEF